MKIQEIERLKEQKEDLIKLNLVNMLACRS